MKSAVESASGLCLESTGEDKIRVYFKEEKQLKLVYEDNGVGIPDEKKPIFSEKASETAQAMDCT